jgi:4-hydroxybenzoate polyprenyltransferase
VLALVAAFSLRVEFGFFATAYVALLAFYSGPLKHVVIIDVLRIAIGFVLRAAAGAVVIDVPISNWLLVITILGALFLALSKRRHEIAPAPTRRRVTGRRCICRGLLDQMISVVTASTLVAYAFYTINPRPWRFHTTHSA